MSPKRLSFQPVAACDSHTQENQTLIMKGHLSLDSKGVFSASLWVWLALGLMTVSNVLFFVSFVTNHWGLAQETNGTYWQVGLWQSCRYNSHHDLCIGPGWPAFYSAARSFMVMSLFGHVLVFAWLIGYALEKLLEYDPCTVGCLVALSFSTCIFMIIALVCFGLHWPPWVRGELAFIESVQMGYSVWVAAPCVLLLFATGVLLMIEIQTSLNRLLEYPPFHPFKDKQQLRRNSITTNPIVTVEATDEISNDADEEICSPESEVERDPVN